MKLINETSHRILAYLVALEGQTYHPTPEEIDAYARGADQARKVISGFQAVFTSIVSATLRETVETETAAQWLVRLKLAQAQDNRFRSTSLGRALLAAANEQEAMLEASPPLAIVLKQDDEFALATVMAKIAEIGPGSLVDPYLRMEGFVQLAQHARITRIITGPKTADGRLQALSAGRAALEDVDVIEVLPEIRVVDVFHDRYLIPDIGPIWMFGTSLNGVGKRASAMVQVAEEPGGRAIRAAVQDEWARADSLADFIAETDAAASSAKARKLGASGRAPSGG